MQTEDLVDEIIDGYKVLELVGEGGFSKVYKVCPVDLEEQFFALKYVINPAHKPLLEAEAKILAKLKHPRIPTPIKTGSFHGGSYLLMDFIPSSVQHLLDESDKLPWHQALDIAEQVLTILQYTHKLGVVHKDLKPRNIGLDVNGQVYLFDFNIAKTLQQDHHSQLQHSEQDDSTLEIAGVQRSLRGGTEGYRSPEQRRLKVDGQIFEVDQRSDIYTLGVMLYEMLVGHLPEGSYKKPSSVSTSPSWLNDIIDKALAQNPKERYQNATEMLNAIQLAKQGGSAFARFTHGVSSKISNVYEASVLGILTVVIFIYQTLRKIVNCVLWPLKAIVWLLTFGLPCTIARHGGEDNPLILITFFFTIGLWIVPIGSPFFYYSYRCDQEFEKEVQKITGTVCIIKDNSIGLINAKDLLKEQTAIQYVVTHHKKISSPIYLNKTLYWIGDGPTNTSNSIYAFDIRQSGIKKLCDPGWSLQNLLLLERDSKPKLCFSNSSDHWYSIGLDGKDLREENLIPTAKEDHTISPDKHFQLTTNPNDKLKLQRVEDRWGSMTTQIRGPFKYMAWFADEIQ